MFPSQKALLGMNRQINFDMPLALAEHFLDMPRRLKNAETLEEMKADFFKTNEYVRKMLPQCFEVLEKKHKCGMMNFMLKIPGARNVMERLSMRIMMNWRKTAWEEAENFIEGNEKDRKIIVRRLDRRCGNIAKIIAGPIGLKWWGHGTKNKAAKVCTTNKGIGRRVVLKK